MSISLIFYTISVLHNLDCFLGILIFSMFVIGGVTIIRFCITYAEADDSVWDRSKYLSVKGLIGKYIKPYFVTLGLVSLFNCFIPSSLTMYSLVGINYLSDSKIPDKVVHLVNMKLDEYIASQIPSGKDSK